MKFEQTAIPGVWLVEFEHREDSRGFFARTFCEREFAQHGLLTRFVQCNLSANKQRGTLRGMHFQNEPKPEVKLVRCVRGSIYDVVIDLRRDSSTYCKWVGVELSADNGQALYIPAGIAHGFQTLEDNTELYYHMRSRLVCGNFARMRRRVTSSKTIRQAILRAFGTLGIRLN